MGWCVSEAAAGEPVFNREPLAEKPYAELPLGTIQPQGWLRDELRRMALGMTGNLDAWYPEVCGPRNAWLGGDGDCWERGPYWIDGLYPLAKLLEDEQLEAKAQAWIEWTLENQREDGYIGPRTIENRSEPPPRGAQTIKPDDWWPRMVMLKILQQHYMATADQRVLECLDKYFRYQLKTLPEAPLYEPDNPRSGSWWAAQRGGDNLMVVLWFYNVTGEEYLLELADLIYQQTVPVTDWFGPGPENKLRRRADQGDTLHCVNLAQMMKTPVIRWQQDPQQRHLDAVKHAFQTIRTFHGQPHGLYGGDESLHGDAPNRGSELCTAVEMMYSLEKMFEVTGDPALADRLERIAFNVLPTQCTSDYRGRQYFQQTNQVQCTFGERDFFQDRGDRVVYGLLRGYPCCTCNLHQAWPKFAQHLWLASRDGGLAVAAYAPSRVTTSVADNVPVALTMNTEYPFKATTTIEISTENPIQFPLHLRIPGWATEAEIQVNGTPLDPPRPGSMHIVRRTWVDGDTLTIRFPMKLRTSTWYARSKVIERGPLVYALDLRPVWSEQVEPRPEGVPQSAMHRGYREARTDSDWNVALPGFVLGDLDRNIRVEEVEEIPANPWTHETAPVRLHTRGVKLPYWKMDRNSAAPPPLSPAPAPEQVDIKPITLIPYGSSTLRIAEFPWIQTDDLAAHLSAYPAEALKFAGARASHTWQGDTVEAVRMPHQPSSSNDHLVRRWTSWPQRGKQQWVEVDLGDRVSVRSLSVYWFDDEGGCDVPGSWHVEFGDNDRWQPMTLQPDSAYSVQPDRYNQAQFEAVDTRKLRIVMQPSRDDVCVGILALDIETQDVDFP